MQLPQDVLACVNKLEQAGYATYAVGGCVRDFCLGLQPHDYDLCTAALPEDTERVFADHSLVLAGKKHGTVGVVTSGGVVEITTFRTEGGYQDNRRPDWVKFVPRVEEDLARRDFTVNAMAFSPTRGFADPFGGREDLKNGILRAVGDAEARFCEDSLRILRGVRFAVRFRLTPEEKTGAAMAKLAPLMEHLARERVLDELCKLLPLVTAADLIAYADVLGAVIPELKPTFHFDQHNPHHAYDLYTHIANVTGRVPPVLELRWAALLHDVGKVATFTRDAGGRGHFYGHAKVGAQLADAILRRLKAPTALRERVVFLVDKHMTPLEPDRKLLRRRLSRYGVEETKQLLALQRADFGSKGVFEPEIPFFDRVEAMINGILAEEPCLCVKDLAVNGRDLIALGYPAGPGLGQALAMLLEKVTDETLPNDRDALLNEAKRQLPEQNA